MLKSYLTIALKHLTSQKLYSAINILGLAVGLGCFILIGLFVRYELGYDRQWADADRIYRVSRDYFARDGARARVPASANAPIAPALVAEFPEVEIAARVIGGQSEQAGRVFGARSTLSRDELVFHEDRLRFADPELFEIFDFDWIEGDPRTALAQPNAIVLTRSLATKYFGAESPIGQTVNFNRNTPLTVTGVMADLPENTHLSLDAVVPMSLIAGMMGPDGLERWNSSTDFHTYIRLRDGADVDAVRSGVPQFLDRHIENGSAFSSLTLTPIADVHLRSNRDEEWKTPGSLSAVYSFAAIAIGILLIACINFMNLSTARAATRAREVAVRKSMGASKGQMIRQFLGESVLYAAVATVLAIAIVELALPPFRAFTGAAIELDYIDDPGVLAALGGLTLLVGLFAGSYPAFYLSAFGPAKVLKGDVTRGRAGALFRNALVVTQFAIAIVLVISTAVIYRQTTYARTIDLGFNKNQIVVLTGSASEGIGNQWEAFRQKLLDDPSIVSVTASHYTPFAQDDNSVAVRRPGDTSFSRIQFMAIDRDFFETYEMNVTAGRQFSLDAQSDLISLPSSDNPIGRGGLMLNEAAARLLGWTPTEGADWRVDLGLSEDFMARIEGTVVGIVGDAHFESLEVAIRPLIFILAASPRLSARPLNFASIRIDGASVERALAHIDATWAQFQQSEPITRHFLDQDFEALYRNVDRQGRMFSSLALLAIFVACLGLLGLASFVTQQRTKEIGVRKVMGGTVADVVRLFTGEFSRLVLLANVIAWPTAYFLMRAWLDNFAYRIDLGIVVFLIGAAITLGVAVATVGTVAARAASTNPIHALRYE